MTSNISWEELQVVGIANSVVHSRTAQRLTAFVCVAECDVILICEPGNQPGGSIRRQPNGEHANEFRKSYPDSLGFDTNRTIRETFTEAGFPVPDQHLAVATAALVERQDGQSSAATH